MAFTLPWEEEPMKRIIDTFQCKVISMEPIKEGDDKSGNKAMGDSKG